MAYLICLAGPDSEEKNALLTGLARGLCASGRRVGVIRPDEAEAPGMDEAREFSELVVGHEQVTLTRRERKDLSADVLAGRYLDEMEVVISAVDHGAKRAKLEYVPAGGKPALLKDPGLKALISPDPQPDWPRVFSPDQTAEIVAYLLGEVIPDRPQAKVRITIGNKKIPANHFVRDITAATIKGLLSSLKGVDDNGRIVIVIDA